MGKLQIINNGDPSKSCEELCISKWPKDKIPLEKRQ
jgi:hypothetical protein